MVTNKISSKRELGGGLRWVINSICQAMGEVELMKPNICYRDEGGNCPYSNEVGTCFGFCMKEILKEQRERKQKHEQTEEDKENYG